MFNQLLNLSSTGIDLIYIYNSGHTSINIDVLSVVLFVHAFNIDSVCSAI